MLIGFYTFFRKSNLVPKSEKDFDPAKNLCRHDIFVRPLGLVICVRWSKTIQFRELQFPFCSSPRVTLSAPCTHMNVTFDNSRSPSLSLLSSITEKVKPLPLHTRHSPTNRGRFSVTQASRPKFSPWWSFLRLPLRCSRGTYQSSRGLVFGRCFALHRTTTWAAALSGETDCPEHWLFITFIFNYYKLFLSPFPSPRFFFFFSFGVSLSGGLGEPHQRGRPSVSPPSPAAAWLFSGKQWSHFCL